jgi:hypothetical protein
MFFLIDIGTKIEKFRNVEKLAEQVIEKMWNIKKISKYVLPTNVSCHM